MSPNLEWWAKGVGLLPGWGPEGWGAQTQKSAAPKGGAPKGGAPKGWGPEGWGPKGWGTEGWGTEGWGPDGWGAQNFALFFSLPATIFFLSSLSLGGPFVEFLVGFLKRRGPEMCTFGVLRLS